MRKFYYKTIILAKERLKDLVFSHNEPYKIREGNQVGMYVQELTNYRGQGCSIKVIAEDHKEAEAMALIILNALNKDIELTGGTYNNRGEKF